jgi:hypothetical protein
MGLVPFGSTADRGFPMRKKARNRLKTHMTDLTAELETPADRL